MVFSNEQVGSMMEEICGEAVHTHFEDTEYGPDLMHPSDIGCRSVEDGVSSDDNAIHKKARR